MMLKARAAARFAARSAARRRSGLVSRPASSLPRSAAAARAAARFWRSAPRASLAGQAQAASQPSASQSAQDGAIGELETAVPNERKRNIAIIAHVDHGKTSLVDCLLRQSATAVKAADGERVMDSNALEKERGITIMSKSTGLLYENADGESFHINVVDTPGHADFGGEVERVLSMVDGVALVVDATEGPMTQTKFVLRKALEAGLRPFVVVNKVDRDSSRVGEVENEIFDLFVSLNANDEQLDFPIVYASARDGWAVTDLDDPDQGRTDMGAVFRSIIDTVPPPVVEEGAPFRMAVTQIEANRFLGKCLIGRVRSGSVSVGDQLHALDEAGEPIEKVRVQKVLARIGLDQMAVPTATAGDIVSLAGFDQATVNSTLCDLSVTEPIKTTPIDPPTLSMTFQTNTSPLAGRDGTYVTAAKILERLEKEVATNVSLRLKVRGEKYEVQGRGEIQLGVLLETMRREGYEVAVSPPKVVFRDADGNDYVHESSIPMNADQRKKLTEPMEEVQIEVPDEFAGMMMEKMAARKGMLQNYEPNEHGGASLVFNVPTRGLVGFRSEAIDATRGTATINSIFNGYEPHQGVIARSQKGALISTAGGKTTSFALDSAQARGVLFVGVGEEVYPGMVVGQSSREADVEINVVKAKAVNNIRTMLKDEKTRITKPREMTLEAYLSTCEDDELVEVCPNSVRLRKAELDPAMRRKLNRASRK